MWYLWWMKRQCDGFPLSLSFRQCCRFTVTCYCYRKDRPAGPGILLIKQRSSRNRERFTEIPFHFMQALKRLFPHFEFTLQLSWKQDSPYRWGNENISPTNFLPSDTKTLACSSHCQCTIIPQNETLIAG